jgi:hypothetical protein
MVHRLEFWRECRKHCPQETKFVITHQEQIEQRFIWELQQYGFVKLPSSTNERSEFRVNRKPDTSLDLWCTRLISSFQPRYGRKPVPIYTLEWCMNHYLTQKLSDIQLQRKRVLFLWAGPGEWPFILWEKYGCDIIAMEASWYALDYAVSCYGSSHVRFLPYSLPFFPDSFFDVILFYTFPDRIASLSDLITEWDRVAKPNADIILGLFSIKEQPHPMVQNNRWLERYQSNLDSLKTESNKESIFVQAKFIQK